MDQQPLRESGAPDSALFTSGGGRRHQLHALFGVPAWIAPVAGLVTTLLTLVVCYGLAFKYGHLLTLYPFISLTGYLAPERYFYCGGFVFVAGCLSASVITVWGLVGAQLERAGGSKGAGNPLRLVNAAACVTGVAAASFLALQGIVPLQENVRLLMDGTLPASAFNLQSAVHAGSALLFFLLTALHGAISVPLLYRAAGRRWTTSVKVKLALAALVVLLLALACGLSPGAFGSLAAAQIGGPVLQYLLILAIAAFYGSYVIDIRAGGVSIALLEPHAV